MGRFLNADAFASTGQGLLSNNMFAYCLNNPVNMDDSCGNLPQWLSNLKDEVMYALGTFKAAIMNSCSMSTEHGTGFGVKGKVMGVSAEATFIIAADEKTTYLNGTTESSRKTTLAVQAKIFEEASFGLELGRSAPIKSARIYGTLGAQDGESSVSAGAYIGNWGVGYRTAQSQDWKISFGLAGYFFVGGGFELSFNLTEFVEVWKVAY